MKRFTILTIIILSLAGCNQAPSVTEEAATQPLRQFKGETGQTVSIENETVIIAEKDVGDGVAHYYNTKLPNGDTVYFFIVKSADGKLRAAANGCQVCGAALQGFHQEGDFMVCNTCGNKYPLNKIATEKGGCNPAPINPDLKITDGNVKITLNELENINQFFN